MELITSDILHPDFQVQIAHSPGHKINQVETFSREEILNCVDQAKTFLLIQGCRPGQKIILTHNVWPHYLIWFLAGADLGLTFVVSDYPKMTRFFSVKKKLELYGEIDIVIGTQENDAEWKFFKNTAKHIFEMLSYSMVKATKAAKQIFATPETVLIAATSSGSTGTPKIIKHTHSFFYRLMHRNAKLYDLKSHDRCLHTKILHHGSVTGVFFLPTLKYCKYHFHCIIKDDIVERDDWVAFIQENKLSRVFLMDDMLTALADNLKLENKINDDMIIYVLTSIDRSAADRITKDFGYPIQSIFGCTETSGPLFLPVVNAENVESFDKNNQGKILDDFYKIRLNQTGLLEIDMPDGKTVCTGDRFSINKHQEWVHGGRDDVYRINGQPVYIDPLAECIENFTKRSISDQSFDIVIDTEMNSIYLRTDSRIDLEKLNDFILDEIQDHAYLISTVVLGNKKDFYTGIKFDPEEVRLQARNQLTKLPKDA
jgi:acyl-CoA synthetase (AMP-forming)/AMP-acid ligase II